MIPTYTPDSETFCNFKKFLLQEYKDAAIGMIKAMEEPTGTMVVVYDEIKFETHIIAVFGSYSWVEVYKQLSPTNFKRIPNNNEGLLPNTAPKPH
ncbi:MAG: hypothetical protein WC319_09445 [Candidatus Paceibacterota bacterium]|jgi:hypothetical protein